MTLVQLNREAIREASRIVSEGGVIAYPTDTVYGLGCDPFNEAAVRRVITAKRRSRAALPVLISSFQIACQLGNVTSNAAKLATAFWPGPLTIVVATRRSLPQEISGDGTVGLRIPKKTETILLINACGGALVGTSANLSGIPSARTAAEVLEQLGGMVDLVLDGGACTSNSESTVIDVSREDQATILRSGAIREDSIRNLLPDLKLA